MRREFETLLVEDAADGVLRVSMNRPDSLNALNDRSMLDLADLWSELRNDPDEVGAVVFTGAGRAFCAGGDVKGMDSADFDVKRVSLSDLADRVWKGFLAVPQPLVAAVNGDAVGAGMFLAALCDFVIAADSARFGDPHVRVGLVASGGGMLVPTIGLHHTKALLLSGELVSASRAAEMGLIHSVVPKEDVLVVAEERAAKLAALPREAVRWTKRSLNRLLDQSWSVGWEAELAFEALSALLPSHREAVAKFAKKG